MFDYSPNPNLNSKNLLFFIIKWRKALIIVGLLSIVLSIIFSGPFFIKPKFKSTVIFFPANTNSVSKALLNQDVGNKKDILEFGEEEQAEQLLQILNSDEVRNRVMQKYDLMKHYGIDPSASYPYTALSKEFENNITFERTEFMSVRVDVLDIDAQMAADIANDVAALLDSVKTRMERERAIDGLKIVEKAYQDKVMQIQQMEDSLKIVREKGVFDYKTQSRVVSTEYVRTIASGKSSNKELQHQIDILAEYGGASVSISELLKLEREELTILKTQYEKAKIDASQNLTHKFIVNNAVKAEKKTTPVRWLIVLITFISSMLLAVVIIMLLENYKKLNS